jgi:hypothetical protein
MYKIKLTNLQIHKIYDISDKPATQSSLMSILSYLIKYTDKTTNMLTKSLSKLYKMYLRYHDKITRSYFFTLVNKLKENELVLFHEDKKEDKKEDNSNPIEPIENTPIESYSKKPNNPTTNHNTYIYTSNTSSDVIEAAEEILKELNIKSKHIKNMVLESLYKAKIDSKGMISYIYAVILDKVKAYYKNRDIYKQKVLETKNIYNFAINKKQSTRYKFNNFEGRDMYNDPVKMKSLEECLTNFKGCNSDIELLLSQYRY